MLCSWALDIVSSAFDGDPWDKILLLQRVKDLMGPLSVVPRALSFFCLSHERERSFYLSLLGFLYLFMLLSIIMHSRSEFFIFVDYLTSEASLSKFMVAVGLSISTAFFCRDLNRNGCSS
jgi:hypothetical protein